MQQAVPLLEQLDGPLGLLPHLVVEGLHLQDEVRPLREGLHELGPEGLRVSPFPALLLLQPTEGLPGFHEAGPQGFGLPVAALELVQVEGHGVQLPLELLGLGFRQVQPLVLGPQFLVEGRNLGVQERQPVRAWWRGGPGFEGAGRDRHWGRNRQGAVQGVLQAVQPVIAQFRIHQLAQGIVRIQGQARHQRPQLCHEGARRDGLVQVEVRASLQSLVAPVLFRCGLGTDEGHLHVVELGVLSKAGAQGIALVVPHLDADQRGGEGPALQTRQDPVDGACHLQVKGRFETDLVLLEEAPVVVHEKEALTHDRSLSLG